MNVSWVVSPVVVAAVGGTQRVEIFLLTTLQLDVLVESSVTCPPVATRRHDDDDQDGDHEYGRQADDGD